MALFIISGIARGNSVVPGATVPPDFFANEVGTVTVAGTITGTYATASTSGAYTTYAVLTAGGTYDFVYQFTSDPGSSPPIDDIRRITMSSFTGYTTDVGIAALLNGGPGPYGAGTVFPQTVDRSISGSVVGFNFSLTGLGGFPLFGPGLVSQILVIKTNATDYRAGIVSLIDGTTADRAAFAPAGVAVPLPPAVWAGLSLMGLMGVQGVRRQRLKKVSE